MQICISMPKCLAISKSLSLCNNWFLLQGPQDGMLGGKPARVAQAKSLQCVLWKTLSILIPVLHPSIFHEFVFGASLKKVWAILLCSITLPKEPCLDVQSIGKIVVCSIQWIEEPLMMGTYIIKNASSNWFCLRKTSSMINSAGWSSVSKLLKWQPI